MDRRVYNRIATKKHIENTLLQLLSEGKYLHQISTSQLCTSAGIAKSTFYLYFQDKYAVMEGIVADTLEALKNINDDFEKYNLSDIASGKPTTIARNVVRYLAENRAVFCVLFGPTGAPDFMYNGKAEIESKFKELYRALNLSPRHEQLVASQFFSGVVGLFRFYFFENREYSDDQMAVIFGNMLKSVLSLGDNL